MEAGLCPAYGAKPRHHTTHIKHTTHLHDTTSAHQLTCQGRVFPIFSEQADAVDSGGAGERDDVGYVLKIRVVVCLDEGDALDANREDVG